MDEGRLQRTVLPEPKPSRLTFTPRGPRPLPCTPPMSQGRKLSWAVFEFKPVGSYELVRVRTKVSLGNPSAATMMGRSRRSSRAGSSTIDAHHLMPVTHEGVSLHRRPGSSLQAAGVFFAI